MLGFSSFPLLRATKPITVSVATIRRKDLFCIPSTRFQTTSEPGKFRVSSSPLMEKSGPVSTHVPTVDEELVLQTAGGDQIRAFLTSPLPEGPRNASSSVIFMSDILGYQNDDTRAVARRIAASGLPTIIPDLFRGQPWIESRSKAEYEEWRSPHTSGRVRSDVVTAREALRKRGLGESVALVGFCFGGGRLMEEIALSTNGLNPKAAVAFYPTRFNAEDTGQNASCPLLFITGDNDHLVPMDTVQTLEHCLNNNSKISAFEVDVCTGLGHAFAHHPNSEKEAQAGERAMKKALLWLHTHLEN